MLIIQLKNGLRLIYENVRLNQVNWLGVLIRSVNFVTMKSQLWILGVVMGLSFLSLLYLQIAILRKW